MILKKFRKDKYRKAEASLMLKEVLLSAQRAGFKALLISIGNYSKSDYIEFAREINARPIASRSIFRGWLKWLSILIPASWIGALTLEDNTDCAEKIIKLADHGYIWILLSRNPDIEEVVRKVVDNYSLRSNWAAQLPDHVKTMIFNGETPDMVEVQMDFSQADFK